jgi:hypothetical protein
MSFGLEHVAPALPDFLAGYPAISIDLHLSDEAVDLVGGGFNLVSNCISIRILSRMHQLSIPAEVSDGTGRGSPDRHRRAER